MNSFWINEPAIMAVAEGFQLAKIHNIDIILQCGINRGQMFPGFNKPINSTMPNYRCVNMWTNFNNVSTFSQINCTHSTGLTNRCWKMLPNTQLNTKNGIPMSKIRQICTNPAIFEICEEFTKIDLNHLKQVNTNVARHIELNSSYLEAKLKDKEANFTPDIISEAFKHTGLLQEKNFNLEFYLAPNIDANLLGNNTANVSRILDNLAYLNSRMGEHSCNYLTYPITQYYVKLGETTGGLFINNEANPFPSDTVNLSTLCIDNIIGAGENIHTLADYPDLKHILRESVKPVQVSGVAHARLTKEMVIHFGELLENAEDIKCSSNRICVIPR